MITTAVLLLRHDHLCQRRSAIALLQAGMHRLLSLQTGRRAQQHHIDFCQHQIPALVPVK